jgi:cytoskeletal protein CcmA (bactofilin family)
MDMSHIGASIRIKGEVTAQEPLTISGQVDGSVDVSGHELTVAAGGRVTADLTAERIVISGEAKGKLTAAAVICVAATGQVEGELKAPAVSFADGAYVKGHVEATGKSPKLSLLRTA